MEIHVHMLFDHGFKLENTLNQPKSYLHDVTCGKPCGPD